MVFSSLVAIGVQASLLSIACLICALIGMFISPLKRDYLFNAFFIFSAGFGNFNGFVAAKLYKSLNGTEWLLHGMMNGILLPFTVAMIVSLIDLGELVGKMELTSMYTIKIPSLINEVFALWLLFDIPGTLIGYVLGLKSPKITWSVKPSRLERSFSES